MTTYWLLFFTSAVISLMKSLSAPGKHHTGDLLAWMIAGAVLTLIIGFRHEVGGDWVSYFNHVDYARDAPLAEVMEDQKDPAYSLLNWLGANIGGGVYFVNLASAAIFTFGLVQFCRNQTQPWLALAVSIPYLVIVVAMGYTRQSVALGIVMLSFVALERGYFWRFLFFVVLASLFHKSAIVVTPLAIFSINQKRWLIIPSALLLGFTLFALLVQESLTVLMENYIESEYSSSGALMRIMMNAVAAGVFLATKSRLSLAPQTERFWTWTSWSSISFLLILQLSPSSTAVDRIALYWIPLQVFAWSRLPDALPEHGLWRSGLTLGVLCYCFAVLYVWLNFAENSFSWLPYHFYPFE